MFRSAANSILSHLRELGFKHAHTRESSFPDSSVYVVLNAHPGAPAVLVKDGRGDNDVEVIFYGLPPRSEGFSYELPAANTLLVAQTLAGKRSAWDSSPSGRLERRTNRPW